MEAAAPHDDFLNCELVVVSEDSIDLFPDRLRHFFTCFVNTYRRSRIFLFLTFLQFVYIFKMIATLLVLCARFSSRSAEIFFVSFLSCESE